MLDMIGQARILLKIMLTLLRTSCLWQMELDRQQCDIIKNQELMWGGGGWWWWLIGCPPSLVLFVYSTIEDGLASHSPYFCIIITIAK